MNTAPRELRSPKRTVRTPHIDVRMGVKSDAPAIIALLQQFFSMSPWNRHMSFKPERALPYVEHAISTGYEPHVLAFDGEELVGMCSYHLYSQYTDPIACMDECFVLPRLRFTDLGRRVVGLAIDMARADGAVVMHFPIASQMKAQNSLMNMVGRHFGAEPIGMLFRKVL